MRDARRCRITFPVIGRIEGRRPSLRSDLGIESIGRIFDRRVGPLTELSTGSVVQSSDPGRALITGESLGFVFTDDEAADLRAFLAAL